MPVELEALAPNLRRISHHVLHIHGMPLHAWEPVQHPEVAAGLRKLNTSS